MYFCACTEAFGDGSQQVKLPSNQVTFRVDGDLPGISRSDFEAACMEAWKRWERVIGVRVDKHPNPKTAPTQYVIPSKMDGPSGVLADQMLPYGGGLDLRMRVDLNERWHIGDEPPVGKMNLIAVLCHEDGHALGFQHIMPEGDADLMNATYSPKIFVPQEDDISYGRKLYGPPLGGPPVGKPVNMTGKLTLEQDGKRWEVDADLLFKRVA
jgi:hypothetical protein